MVLYARAFGCWLHCFNNNNILLVRGGGNHYYFYYCFVHRGRVRRWKPCDGDSLNGGGGSSSYRSCSTTHGRFSPSRSFGLPSTVHSVSLTRTVAVSPSSDPLTSSVMALFLPHARAPRSLSSPLPPARHSLIYPDHTTTLPLLTRSRFDFRLARTPPLDPSLTALPSPPHHRHMYGSCSGTACVSKLL